VCDDDLVDFRLLCCRLVDLSEGVRDHGLNTLGHVVKVDDLCGGLRLQAVQPVEEFHQHFQSILLAIQRQSAPIPRFPFILMVLLSEKCLSEKLMLKSDGVVKEEPLSPNERIWDAVIGEVQREETWDIGEHEGDVIS